MPPEQTDGSVLRQFHKDTDMTAEMYVEHFNLQSVLQSGAEHEWQMFAAALGALPETSRVLVKFRELYEYKVKKLLSPETMATVCPLSQAEQDELLRNRRLLLMDIRSSALELADIRDKFLAGTQRTLWSEDNYVNVVRDLHDSDIPQVKCIEAVQHEHAWSGKQFAEFFGLRARSAKLYDRYNKQSPFVGKVSGTSKTPHVVTGYLLANRMNATRQYKTIHGVMNDQRRCLQVLTFGTQEAHADWGSKALTADMLACARILECTRIENLFEEHHKG